MSSRSELLTNAPILDERVAIRRATQDDRAAIWRVHTRSITQLCRRHYTPEQLHAWTGVLQPESYAEVIQTRDFFVAEVSGAVAGFAQLNTQAGEVEALYIEPGFVGRGIGRALLAELEAIAGARRLESLHLASTLNAVSFYEQAGFKGGTRTEHELPNGVRLPCIEMRKMLKSEAG